MAGDAVLVEIPFTLTVSEKPGGSEPVHVTADAVWTVTVVRYVPAQVAVVSNAKPVGAKNVMDVIAYALLMGFDIWTVVITAPAPDI